MSTRQFLFPHLRVQHLSSAFNVVEVPALQSRIICHHLCFWGFLPAVHLKELLWSRIKQRLSHLFFTEQCSFPLSTDSGESKLGAEEIIKEYDGLFKIQSLGMVPQFGPDGSHPF